MAEVHSFGSAAGTPELGDILDALIDHVAIGSPVRDRTGAIVDFVLEYMNAASIDGAGRGRDQLVGRLVCDLYPEWRASGLFDRFRYVVETGVPWSQERIPYEGTTPDGVAIRGWWSIRVVPFGDGYLAASRDVTAAVEEERALHAAQQEADANRLAVELLQRAALPGALPELDGVELGARYRAAGTGRPVGGDWFDAVPLGDRQLALVIADVAGHGQDAAAHMVQVRNYVRALAVEHGEPATVLGRANRVLAALDQTQLFATCLYGVVDLEQRSFCWATAGHLPPLHLGDAPALLASPAGPPLGVESDAAYAAAEVPLAVGDRIVLYTDGLVEERAVPLGEALDGLVLRAAAWDGLGAKETADVAAAEARGVDDDLAVVCCRLAG
ncbi:MAG: SpoIIE family protein phosphatase [Acidimicrobiales bacterium]